MNEGIGPKICIGNVPSGKKCVNSINGVKRKTGRKRRKMRIMSEIRWGALLYSTHGLLVRPKRVLIFFNASLSSLESIGDSKNKRPWVYWALFDKCDNWLVRGPVSQHAQSQRSREIRRNGAEPQYQTRGWMRAISDLPKAHRFNGDSGPVFPNLYRAYLRNRTKTHILIKNAL